MQDVETVRVEDLKLEHFMPAEEVEAAELRYKGVEGAAKLAEAPTGTPSVVLLTGATGFLGRFLLLDLLKKVRCREGWGAGVG